MNGIVFGVETYRLSLDSPFPQYEVSVGIIIEFNVHNVNFVSCCLHSWQEDTS